MTDLTGIVGLTYEVWEHDEMYAAADRLEAATPYVTDLASVLVSCERYATQPCNPADPTTWTRDQLVAELQARMGLKAPKGWEWMPAWRRWQRERPEGFDGVADSGQWEVAYGHFSLPVSEGTAPTLTGPDGAFAQAERVAGVDHD